MWEKPIVGANYHKEPDQQRSLFQEPEISLASNTNNTVDCKRELTEEIEESFCEWLVD